MKDYFEKYLKPFCSIPFDKASTNNQRTQTTINTSHTTTSIRAQPSKVRHSARQHPLRTCGKHNARRVHTERRTRCAVARDQDNNRDDDGEGQTCGLTEPSNQAKKT